MIISVNWFDIWFGKRHEAKTCPIARALRRKTGRVFSVGATEIRDRRDQSFSPQVQLPLEARAFVYSFDFKEGKVRPFSFELPDNLM